jgi:hypothetical protein
VIGPLIVEAESRLDQAEKMIGLLLRVGFGRKENGYSGNASRSCEGAGDSPRKRFAGRSWLRAEPRDRLFAQHQGLAGRSSSGNITRDDKS